MSKRRERDGQVRSALFDPNVDLRWVRVFLCRSDYEKRSEDAMKRGLCIQLRGVNVQSSERNGDDDDGRRSRSIE